MAFTTVPEYWYPAPVDIDHGGAVGTAGVTLNASGDRCGFVIQCPKAGTLDKFEFLTGSVSNNPDNGIRLSFQTIDVTTGFPDTTQDQFRDITGTISANTWQVPGLITSDGTDGGVKRTVTAGEYLGCVVDFVSFVASDSFDVEHVAGNTNGNSNVSAYVASAATGSYSKVSGGYPTLALKYNDGTYASFALPAILPATDWASTNFNSGSTPDEYAIRFQVPYKVRTNGFWFRTDPNAAFDVVLYDNASSVMSTFTFDSDIVRAQTHHVNYGYWSSVQTIEANTTYRLALKPTTVTNIAVDNLTVSSNTYFQAVPPGIEWYQSTRTDAGAWTDFSNIRPLGGLLINGIEFTAGGSGGSFAFVG